jgi:hypothetical protein
MYIVNKSILTPLKGDAPKGKLPRGNTWEKNKGKNKKARHHHHTGYDFDFVFFRQVLPLCHLDLPLGAACVAFTNA